MSKELVLELIDSVRREHGVTLRADDPIITTVLLNEALLRRRAEEHAEQLNGIITNAEMLVAGLSEKNQQIAEQTLSRHVNALIGNINSVYSAQTVSMATLFDDALKRYATALSRHRYAMVWIASFHFLAIASLLVAQFLHLL